MSVSGYSNSVPVSALMPQTNQNPINTANNRLLSATYDPRGNMTQVAAGSESMAYDAENRQRQTVDGGQIINYLYDADGERVQKQLTGGATVVCVHDASGELVAEYNSAGVTPVCTTCYLTYDQLGSVRMMTDQKAAVVARHDYLPYGEEIPNGSAGRSGNGFGNSGNTAQMFTGQERDGGTADLDYFNARHMSAVMGRFTQPDPGNAGSHILNPQTWNAYAYVIGNPLALTDSTGMDCDPSSEGSDGPCFGIVVAACRWYQFWCYLGSSSGSGNDSGYSFSGGGPGGGGSSGEGGAGGGGTKPIPIAPTPPAPPLLLPPPIVTILQNIDPSSIAPDSQILTCLVEGIVVGAATAAVVGVAATLAAPVVGAGVVSAALFAGPVYGGYSLYNDVSSNVNSGNTAGLAYDAGSLLGGAAVGYFRGGATASGIKPGASSGWSLTRDIASRFEPSMGLNPLTWFGTGPDAGAAGGAQTAAGQAVSRRGC